MSNLEKNVFKKFIDRTVELSFNALKNGNNPFAALLLSKENKILLEQKNIERVSGDCTCHAETVLIRQASIRYSKAFLKDCKLVSIAEPCAMCSGAIYWSNVGTVIYGLSESKLLELTGNNPLNPTMSLPCRTVFASGQKDITIIGPLFEEEIVRKIAPVWSRLNNKKL